MASKLSRQARDAWYAHTFQEAQEAGRKAGNGHSPTPMMVVDSDVRIEGDRVVTIPRPDRQQYHVPEGLCGFAWVSVRPGTHTFARWLKNNQGARKAYRGGVQLWMRGFGQSYERKMACAEAMAKSLRAELCDDPRLANPTLSIYAGGRLD